MFTLVRICLGMPAISVRNNICEPGLSTTTLVWPPSRNSVYWFVFIFPFNSWIISKLYSQIELTGNSCVVHCRDPRSDELTVAVGETGWFPSGTLCDLLKPSYCLSGKCVVSTFLQVFTLVRCTLTLTVVKL
jgi:hypothetical protein